MKTYRSFNSTRILFGALTLATTLGSAACSIATVDEQPKQGNVSEDAADLSAAFKKPKARPAIAEFRGGTGGQTSTVTVGVTTVGVGATSGTSGSATSGGGTGGYGGSGSTGSGKDTTTSTATTTSGTSGSTTTTTTTTTSGGGGTGGYGGTGGVDSATSGSTVASTSGSSGGSSGVTSGGSSGVTSGGYTTSGSSGTGGLPGGKDPDALDLTITKGAPVCNGDNSVALCDDWRVTISIPVALQHPGTIPLSSLDLDSSFFRTLPDDGSGSGFCGGSESGIFVNGSIEILSIDAEKVVFKLKDTDKFAFNADGKYVAEVCAPPPPPPPPPPAGPTSVIALLESEVVPEPPSGGSSSVSSSSSSSATATSGGGTVVDPDSLRLILSDNPLVCDHPLAPVGCPGWKISIRIPPALQHPGIIPLSSPELSSFGSANFQSEGSTTCSFGGGTFWDGTIEIVSIDATQVTFRLADTQKWMVNADGEYTAPRCFTP